MKVAIIKPLKFRNSERLHPLFISDIFISNARLNLAKNQAYAKQHPETELFCYLKIIHILHPRYRPKIRRNILKNSKRTRVSVFMRS